MFFSRERGDFLGILFLTDFTSLFSSKTALKQHFEAVTACLYLLPYRNTLYINQELDNPAEIVIFQSGGFQARWQIGSGCWLRGGQRSLITDWGEEGNYTHHWSMPLLSHAPAAIKKKKEALLYRGLKARYFNNNNRGLQESNVRRGAQNQQKLGYGKSLTFIFGIRDEKKER